MNEAIQPTVKTLRDLAEMADNMVEVQGPQQNLQGQVDMLQQ